MIKNREYALKKRSIAPGETDKVLNKLEESYLESNGNKFGIKPEFAFQQKLNEQSIGLENTSNSSPQVHKNDKNLHFPKI